jgi:hypothetical protein
VDRHEANCQSITRRAFVALGLGAMVVLDRRRTFAAATGAANAWFWNIVDVAEAGPPVGGPSAGMIDNSMFGVEAHRAGRASPAGSPPAVDHFYLKVELEPDATPGAVWDVGVVWRISDEMDALWWTVTSEGRWQVDRAIWEYAPRAQQALDTGQACSAIESPLLLQAVVLGSVLAWSINGGLVTAATIPANRLPGQVGILANGQESHRRPDGGTPYQQLTLWTLDPNEVSSIPDKLVADLCRSSG